MTLWSMNLWDMSFSGAVFIIAVVPVRAALINQIPKRTFLVLWEIAFCRLLVPFSIPSMFSIHTLIGRALSHAASGATDTDAAISVLAQGQDLMTQKMETLSSGMLSSHPVWSALWCTGMTALALFFTVSCLRCRIEFQASLPVHNDHVEQWLKEHSLKRSVSVRQSDRILAPLTYGIFHPVILMPGKTDWKNTKQLQYVLTHEYIHIRRLDVLKKLIAAAVLCIHWFNPAVWIMFILFNRDVELACDENVVRQFGERSKTVYSLILIDMEERQSGLLPFCNNFSKNAIEERITAIMKMKKITIFSFAAACLIVCGIVTTFATSAKTGSTLPSSDGSGSAWTAPEMQPYGSEGDNYYYLPEDYILDGQTIFTAGYYEAVQLAEGCETRIFVPIDPVSHERLPSDSFSDGTIMEIDGKEYEIHINDNQYTAVPKDRQ